MKKIALLNSYSSNQAASKNDQIKSFLAGPDNSGNLVYLSLIAGSLEHFDCITTDYLMSNEELVRDSYEAVILPFSNMLSPFFKHPVAEFCWSRDIKIVLLSIGVQAPLGANIDDLVLSADSLMLLESAKRGGEEITVRGNISQRVLARYGFLSRAVGCPSLLGIGKIDLESCVQPDARICGNCTLNGEHRELSARMLEFVVENCSGCALQDEARIIRDVYSIPVEEIPFSSFKDSLYHHDLMNKLFDYGYYNLGKYEWGQVRDFFRRNAFFSLDLIEWRAYLRSFALSVGTRFHGNVLAMQSGVPAMFVSCDSRTKELTEFHSLPIVEGDHELSKRTIGKLAAQRNQAFLDNFDRSISPMRSYIRGSVLDSYWSKLN